MGVWERKRREKREREIERERESQQHFVVFFGDGNKPTK